MSSYSKKPKKTKKRFKRIDLTGRDYAPKGMTRAYSDNQYVVMVYDDYATSHGKAIRVMVRNRTQTPIEFHWRTMQMIKNEVFGKEVMAIEYYPKESELIDFKNIYWFWIFPEGIIPTPELPRG
jgi:hypothetical protein